MTTTSPTLPMLIERVRVTAVFRLSPSFVRLELGSPALADFGVEGPLFDQRIKLVLPHGDGPLPSFEGADEHWFGTWLDRPVEERGHMRTYTVRDLVGEGEDTRLVVDVVLHDETDETPAGPGAAWAARAVVGDEVVLMCPRRGAAYGGIEWQPGDADRLLLVGDETAVPAVASILALLPADAVGAAFLEVPLAHDVQELAAPVGIGVTWLVRGARSHGEALHAAVVEHLGGGTTRIEVNDEEVDPDLWETPVWSSSGERVEPRAVAEGHDLRGLYAWIAGESKLVTGLRRVLVKELHVDRAQVSFMGYWRRGVAMRS